MLKQQSAIEYLTTYGWAIVIIAIVLVTLFELGVFTPNSGNQCILEAGFSCTNFLLNSQGVLEFTLNQQTTNPVNITGIACYENGTLLSGQAPFNPPSNEVFMPVGTSTSLYVQCYSNPNSIFTGTIGSYFHGTLAIYYKDAITHLTQLSKGSLIVPISSTQQIFIKGNPLNKNTIAIKLTDVSRAPVPSGFQQEVVINPSQYASYGLNSNLSNLEFTTGEYGSGTPIYAWIQSGASNTATSAIIWLKLPGEITSNGGTQTIYMNIFSNNDPVLLGYTGYAPQLYCSSGCFQTSYAEYDTGMNVFNWYQNWAGINLNPIISTASPVSITQNDGLQFSTTTTNDGAIVLLNEKVTSPFIFESYTTVENPQSAGNTQQGLLIDSNTNTGFTTYGNTQGTNYYFRDGSFGNFQIYNGGTQLYTTPFSISYPYKSMETIGQNSTTVFALDDVYSDSVTTSVLTSGYIGWWTYSSVAQNIFFVQYSFIRDYPPNGAMPSVDILGLLS
ncbi:MAG: hypothetical protein QXD23_02200 [Candidatus Micrarchaeaceae archaeon]